MSSDLQTRFTAFLAQHSRKITIAGGGILVGLMLVMAIMFVLDLMFAPPVPDIHTSSPQAIAGFMAHPRGFSRLSIQGRRKMIFEIYSAGPEMVEQLSNEFAKMGTADREQIRSAAMDVAMDQLVQDARIYRSLPPQKREKFVEEKLDNYEELREQLRGIGDPFKDNLPTKSDQWTKALVSKTSPRQRSQIKPLVDHIVKAAESRREAEKRLVRRRSRNG
jgi:hypothetical protein